MTALLLAHAAATLWMTGLIWFVQVVHYPLFGAVGGGGFPAYQRRHMNRTGWVVVPPMLLELVTGLALLWARPVGVHAWQPWTGVVLLALIWTSTALVQARLHRRLAGGFDPALHRRLVATNWVRTTAWSLRTVLVLAMLGVPGR